MNFCIPKERRPFEFRVGLSPAGVEVLKREGHTVYVEHQAGMGAGFSDNEYEQAGAFIVYSAEEVYGRADVVLKISRPLKDEMRMLRPGSALMGFLHLASGRQEKIDLLLERQVTAIACEQIRAADGSLAVLRPFSQICGSMIAQVAARFLQNIEGGKGILLGGTPGVPPAEVVIIGAGIVGSSAARAFLAMGAHVTVIDRDLSALQRIYERFPGVVTMVSIARNIERAVAYADVVVGAVLVPGERAPIVVTREMLRRMRPRSVIMDISIDEGGCVETSRPTTHDRPTFVEEGIIHYCVPNMPGVVARTATHAFVNAVIPYVMEIARYGIEEAISRNPGIEAAVNTYRGSIHHLSRLNTIREQRR